MVWFRFLLKKKIPFMFFTSSFFDHYFNFFFFFFLTFALRVSLVWTAFQKYIDDFCRVLVLYNKTSCH